jgi:hypothetical protein
MPPPQKYWLISGIQSNLSSFQFLLGIIATAASNAKVPKLQIKQANDAFLDKVKGNEQNF